MRALVSLTCLACAACQPAGAGGAMPSAPPGVTMASLTVTSKSFPSNGAIPVDFTCDGADRSPQLTWSAPPEGTRGFAIVADDPDAPSGVFTHWIAYGLKADARSIPEGADPAALGGGVGINDFKRPGYSGPCPPKLEIHRYYFRVYALSAPIEVPPGVTRSGIDEALSGHVLALGAAVGTFSH